MKTRLIPAWMALVLKLSIIALTVSGFGQMPIFNRYYLSDAPGLGWLAAFYVTHTIHYLAAALFLGLTGYMTAAFARARGAAGRLTSLGWLRAGIVAVVIASGAARVAKNRPDVYLPPDAVFAIDLVHLGAVMIWGLLALTAALSGGRPYLAPARGSSPPSGGLRRAKA